MCSDKLEPIHDLQKVLGSESTNSLLSRRQIYIQTVQEEEVF